MPIRPIPTQMRQGITYKDKHGNRFRLNEDGTTMTVNGITYTLREGRAKQREIQVGTLTAS